MLAEMITKIENLANGCDGPDNLKLLHETPRTNVYELRGHVRNVDKPPMPRGHQFKSLVSLVTFETCDETQHSFWVAEDRVVLVMDDSPNSDRLDRATLHLALSPFFATLEKGSSHGGWLDQKGLVDLIRHDLSGATIDPPNTLSLVRNLKFSVNTEQTGQFDASSAAMGKSVQAAVTGQSALPETVTVEFAPYPALRDVIDASVVIACTLFVDPEKSKLRLSPRPGEIEAAKLAAMESVAKWIAEYRTCDGCSVYLGTP